MGTCPGHYGTNNWSGINPNVDNSLILLGATTKREHATESDVQELPMAKRRQQCESKLDNLISTRNTMVSTP